MVVVDEQHRFGVNQRRALDRKAPEGLAPHVLHMTATPIPRTLALTAYGDLDVTVLRELPAGRRPIVTHVCATEGERSRAYERIREELRAGRQAFVVCPLVEESEALQARAATAEFERLRKGELKDFDVVLLHGQMRPREKQEAMAAFAAGGADVLVATTVIEVGIDVPNASVMLVEDAERYGISQLHQLRGRIGRGPHESLCLLFGPKESARLRALAEHRDGFKLAEIDLELRGEGEMLGTRQSGLQAFRFARPARGPRAARAGAHAGTGDARRGPAARAARARADRRRARRGLRRRRARADPRLDRAFAPGDVGARLRAGAVLRGRAAEAAPGAGRAPARRRRPARGAVAAGAAVDLVEEAADGALGGTAADGAGVDRVHAQPVAADLDREAAVTAPRLLRGRGCRGQERRGDEDGDQDAHAAQRTGLAGLGAPNRRSSQPSTSATISSAAAASAVKPRRWFQPFQCTR